MRPKLPFDLSNSCTYPECQYLSAHVAREVGAESEALLLPLFHHDIHVCCRQCAQYLSRGSGIVVALQARDLGAPEVEEKATWMVEDGREDMGKEVERLLHVEKGTTDCKQPGSNGERRAETASRLI